MSKQTKLPTRRKIVRNRIIAALVMLFLTNWVYRTGHLFPTQVVGDWEERIGAGKLETVKWKFDPEIDASLLSGQIFLVGNPYVTALVGADFDLTQGWRSNGWELLPTRDGQTLYAGAEHYHSAFPRREPGEPWNEILYLFGRVDDPDIQRLEFEIRSGSDLANVSYLTSIRDDWMTEGEYTYFLARWEIEDPQGRMDLQQTTAYDAAGNVVATVSGDT